MHEFLKMLRGPAAPDHGFEVLKAVTTIGDLEHKLDARISRGWYPWPDKPNAT